MPPCDTSTVPNETTGRTWAGWFRHWNKHAAGSRFHELSLGSGGSEIEQEFGDSVIGQGANGFKRWGITISRSKNLTRSTPERTKRGRLLL